MYIENDKMQKQKAPRECKPQKRWSTACTEGPTHAL